jgi:calcineurin-like phosphoesterase family protein
MTEQNLYTADLHFFHKAMITDFSPETRPFDNISQMHEYMIEQHNARATNSTNVYIVGDFACGQFDEKELRKLFEKLKGRKHLIIGNHDGRDVLNLRWSSPPKPWATIKDGDKKIFLCHYAIHSWPGFYNNHYHFFGHTHGKLPTRGRMMDVGVDSWGLMPITANEAVARMREWNPDFETYTPERRTVIQCASDNVPDEEYTPKMINEPGYGGFKP